MYNFPASNTIFLDIKLNGNIPLILILIKFVIKSDQPFHPYRPVWYVPVQGMDYTILDT